MGSPVKALWLRDACVLRIAGWPHPADRQVVGCHATKPRPATELGGPRLVQVFQVLGRSSLTHMANARSPLKTCRLPAYDRCDDEDPAN